eukprot:14775205-Alexandrium_andersonii.AAC.1
MVVPAVPLGSLDWSQGARIENHGSAQISLHAHPCGPVLVLQCVCLALARRIPSASACGALGGGCTLAFVE